MNPTSSERRISRFANALSLALFDKRLEMAGRPIHFFCDTDVVLRMIGGFEADLAPAGYRSAEEQRLVRSLLSCGHFGTLFILRPHAFELDEKLKLQVKYKSKHEQEYFARRARDYLRSHGIENVMSRLRKVTLEAKENQKKVDEFLAILGECGGPAFSAIEMVNGTWMQRLRRYMAEDILSLGMLGPEVAELLAGYEPTVNTVARMLRVRRPRYSLNDQYDALALTALHKMISDAEAGGVPYVARFYTESRYLIEACAGEPSLRKLLSYRNSLFQNTQVPGGAEFIVRDASYFLMRAWFLGLSPLDSGSSIDLLNDLSGRLTALLGAETSYLEKAVAALEFRGKSIEQLIEEFERLAIINNIWSKGRVPSATFSYFSDWTEVFAFAQGELVGEKLFETIEGVQLDLKDKLSRIRAWSDDFELIFRASGQAREWLKGVILDPMRDMGLVRWGYDLSGSDQEDLVGTIAMLLSQEDLDLTGEAAKLATRMDLARNDLSHCLLMSGILWALGLFEGIVALVDDFAESTASLPANLFIIRAAAKIKAGDLSGKEVRNLVNRVWRFKESLPAKERNGALLGVAYILYVAWKRELYRLSLRDTPGDSLEEIAHWARLSFETAEEASQVLPPLELAWAFAVNHCAYVGAVTGLEVAKTESCLQRLIELRDFPGLWNSRFDDTIGTYYLIKAERLWIDAVPEKRHGVDISGSISLAEKFFKEAARRDFGDVDLHGHIARLEDLKHRYYATQGGRSDPGFSDSSEES